MSFPRSPEDTFWQHVGLELLELAAIALHAFFDVCDAVTGWIEGRGWLGINWP